MDMKKHMLICFSIFLLVDREKEWGIYKMEVIIKKGENYNKPPLQSRPFYSHSYLCHIFCNHQFLVRNTILKKHYHSH
jgi:hypothetical protein